MSADMKKTRTIAWPDSVKWSSSTTATVPSGPKDEVEMTFSFWFRIERKDEKDTK